MCNKLSVTNNSFKLPILLNTVGSFTDILIIITFPLCKPQSMLVVYQINRLYCNLVCLTDCLRKGTIGLMSYNRIKNSRKTFFLCQY